MNEHVIASYDEITPHIYLGSNLCCEAHTDKLKSLGATIDISLEDEAVTVPEGLETFIELPVRDHFAPSMQQLYIGAGALKEAESKKYRVYVHCKNGHGRSPTLVIAYFISTGMSFDDAHEFVKSKRNEIHLTEAQVEALKLFEKEVL